MDEKTLLFDIDGTVCPQAEKGEGYENLEPYPKAVDTINKLYREGFKIIFYTSRFMDSHNGNLLSIYKNKGYDFIFNQLKSWGLKFHELHVGKPQSDLIIDDRALFFNPDWNKIYEKIKEKLNGQSSNS